MSNVLKFWSYNVSGILANRNKAQTYKNMYTNVYYSIAFIGKQIRKLETTSLSINRTIE